MPVSKLHGQVAAIALGAAGPHGFALGGGNALIAHGIIQRPTRGCRRLSPTCKAAWRPLLMR